MTVKELPKLVLVEGLPGSGKSTTSHLLCLHCERHGRPARWYYEHETPHPIFEYDEIQDVLDQGRLCDGLFDTALANWRRLAVELGREDRALILESSFLQTAVHAMLLLDWDEARITSYVLDVERAIAPLSPWLILLRQDDVAAGLRETTARRGAWFLEFLEERIRRSRYGQARDLAREDGVARYLEAYRDLTDRLVQVLGVARLILDVERDGRETFVARIADALGLPPWTAFETSVPDLERFTGRYKDAGSDDVYDVVTDGTHLYLDGSPPTRLVHRSGTAFDLAGTCVRLDFRDDRRSNGGGRMPALTCRGNLPRLASDWVRLQ
jgi:adenylate kinase family enzyme